MSGVHWLLNALLLSLLVWWLRYAHRQALPALRPWLLPALGWRLLLTAAVAHWPSADSLHANEQGNFVAVRLLAHPGQALWQLQQARFYEAPTGGGQEVYRWSQTLFFNKLTALLSLLSGGEFALNALCVSLLCFVACWSLVRMLSWLLPGAAPAAGIAFLAWPTVLWWTGGLTKEAVLVGAAAGVVALLLPLLLAPATRPVRQVLGRVLAALLLAWVMTRVRYFFALPLLGGLLALAGVQLATRRGWLGRHWLAQAGAIVLGLGLLFGVAKAVGGELLRTSYFVREVNLNYQHGLLTSPNRPHIVYAHWQPTVAGLLAHAPLAVAETFTRPWPGESAWPLYVGAGLENAALVLLMTLAVAGWLQGRPYPLPAALVAVLLIYCLLLAAFIGLSTPNLGTLNRYRAVLLPWLLWLCLAMSEWRSKRRG